MSALVSARTRQHEQRTRWARFLAQVLPTPDQHRLVPVAEVSRGAVPLVEECLTDAEIPVAVHEIAALRGTEARFEVLVPADQAASATDAIRGL